MQDENNMIKFVWFSYGQELTFYCLPAINLFWEQAVEFIMDKIKFRQEFH